jgi:AcrR family transcriptional regulator
VPAQASERTRIMDAAYRALVADEDATPSMSELLDAAGVGTRAFYRHFGSKDELLLALFRRDAQRMAERLAKVTAAGTPREALTAFVDTMLRVTEDPRRRRRVRILSSAAIARARGYTEESRRFQDMLQDLLVEILTRGRGDGSFPLADPAPDARSMRAALLAAFLEQIDGTADVPAAEAARQVTGFARRAMGAVEAGGGRSPS